MQRAESISQEEETQLRLLPEGENEEIGQIIETNRATGETVELIAESIASNPQLWVDTMMVEEQVFS